MTGLPDVPLPCRIVALMQERNRLFGYPLETLADEIRQIGFTCSRCGTCCTRAVNRHIFLLDKDVDRARSIDSGAFEPAPAPEFCDQNGTLYVSGYALRMHDDDGGPCWFLHNNRCRIYEQRFPICRIYPHMLRRGADRAGNVAWCTFSRMHEHGRYDGDISYDKCLSLAREIKEYENGYLNQQISFLETIHEYFSIHGLRHDPEVYQHSMQQFRLGRPTNFKVFHEGNFEEYRIPRSV